MKRLKIIGGLSVASFCLAPTALQAQLNAVDSESKVVDSRTLEEVLVTARKRTESLQDSPITVSAYGRTQLEDTGVSNLKDLTGIVPNLDLQSGNGVNRDANPYIRGIGQRETRVTVDSGVGIYINGIYIARASGALLDFVDIEQVQVLRGPQGTLFGKNTTGGAIVVDTVKPEQEFGGYIEAVGGNLSRQNVRGSINIPLVEDVLASRFSVSSVRRDGYTINQEDDRAFSDEDNIGWLAQLRWTPSNAVGIDTFIAGTDTKVTPRGQSCLYVNDERGVPEGQALLEGAVNGLTDFNFKNVCEASERSPTDQFRTDMTDVQPQGRDGLVETKTLTAGITGLWSVDHFGPLEEAEFKQILGYRNTKNRVDQDLDATGIPILTRYEPGLNNTNQYSYELQLNGLALDGFLNFTTGIYGFWEETDGQIEQDATLGPLAGNLAGTPGLVLVGSALTERRADNEAYSWFAQSDFNFNEHVSLTLGLRYTAETRETTIIETAPEYLSADAGAIAAVTGLLGVPAPAGFTPADACTFDHINSHAQETYTGFSGGSPGAPVIHYFQENGVLVTPTPTKPKAYSYCNYDSDTASISDSAWTPMASLNLQATDTMLDSLGLDNALLFFTYSQGFRSGVIVDGSNAPSNDFPQLGGADREEVGADFDQADPERVANFEVGLKLEALNRRLRLNSAVFYTDYEDFQLTVIKLNQTTGGPSGVLDNIGGARFIGLEVEATAILPWNLSLIGSLAITDAKLKEFDDVRIVSDGAGGFREVPVDRSDEPPPNVADNQFFVNLIHTASLQDLGRLDSTIQARYIGEVHRHFDRGSFESEQFVSEEEIFLDASIQWTSASESLAARLWVKNLSNIDDYYVGGVPLVDFLGGGGRVFAEPRTYGLDLRYSF